MLRLLLKQRTCMALCLNEPADVLKIKISKELPMIQAPTIHLTAIQYLE
jgi:hypothetical protein